MEDLQDMHGATLERYRPSEAVLRLAKADKRFKQLYVNDLFLEALPRIWMYGEYYDMDSDKMLDEKERVLNDILDGEYYRDIPRFFDIFEGLRKVEPR